MQILKRLFTMHEISVRSYTLLEKLIKIGIVGFFIFANYDYFILSKNMLALFNSIAFIIYLFAYFDYMKYHNFMRTATITTLTLMLFFIIVIIDSHNNDEMLLWTIFVPLFALAINGRVLGTVYSTMYFFILYIIAYSGIDVWNEGQFSQLAYIHYISVTFVLMLFIYYFERSFERYIQEFKEQNKLLNDAQHIGKLGSWVWNMDYDTLKWSDEAYAIFGQDPHKEEITYAKFVKIIHEEDRALVDFAITESIKLKKPYSVIHRIKLDNQEEKTLHERGSTYYRSDGTPYKMIGTVQDITEEKQIKRVLREQKEVLETIFNKTRDGVLLIKDGRFIDCNDAAIKMLNATSKKQLLNALPGDIAPKKQPTGYASKQKAQAMISKALNQGFAHFECYYQRFDGSIFVADVSMTRLEINNETVIHAAWREITEKKALEVELQTHQTTLENTVEEKTRELVIQKERAEAASRAKSEFLTNMNHELRTPLNAILGFIHLLSNEETNPKRKKYFDLVEEGSNSLLSIINDVMDFSKIENGKFTLDLQDVEIANSAKKFIEFLGGAAKKKGIDYRIHIDKNIPTMYTDPLRLQQIISNLIGNAIKFTPERGTIDISLHFDTDHQALIFSVKDNGIGISQENQNKIFDPFTQADMSTTRLYGGTGLGLTITIALLEILEGNLSLKSELGQGSEFGFTLPFKKPHGEIQSSLDYVVPLALSKEEAITYKPILVAEDNDINLYLYEELFNQMGIKNVTFATNGQEALDAYNAQKYQLVLLDINMPLMDGEACYQGIRNYEKEHKIPPSTIIALTANSEESYRKDLLELGFDDFLAKPINFTSFNEMLHKHL